MISNWLTIWRWARGNIWREGRVGKWVLRKSHSRGRRPCKQCLLRMSVSSSILPTGETGPLFFIWKKKPHFFLLEGLDFYTRFGFDIISRHPLNLTLVLWTDKASCLIQNSRGQRWCHCSFERLQFLEYYQEKKVIFLEFSPPSRCPKKEAVSQSRLGNTARRPVCLLSSHLTVLKPWTHSSPSRFLIAVS